MKQAEVEAAIIADPNVPRNDAQECGQTLLNIYGALQGCRDTFAAVVPEFRKVQDFNANLMRVIRFSLPNELKRVDTATAKMLAGANLTDEEYAKELLRVTEARHNVARLGALAQIAYNIQAGIESLESKYVKLSERIRLQKNGSSEWQIAVRKRTSVKDGIAVLKNRRKDIAERFFKVRRLMLEEIAKATRTLDRVFEDKNGRAGARDGDYLQVMLRENDMAVLDELKHIADDAQTKSGIRI